MTGEIQRGVWQRFDHDPRLPAHQHLRAADRDRDVISEVLNEAFAEGRLDRDELDERSDDLRAARTLGQLPPLVADLVSAHDTAHDTASRAATAPLRVQAEEKYAQRRNAALWAFLTPTIICWAVFFATGDTFPWPLFVMLGTGLGALRTATGRAQQVREIERDLAEKEQRREARRRRRLEG